MAALVVGLYVAGWMLAPVLGLLPWYLYPVPLYAALYVPFVGVEGVHTLETDKSPETVRAEFTGPEPPAFALSRAAADDVTIHEDGLECTARRWGFTGVVGYEAERDDGDVVATTTKGGDVWATCRVAIESTADGTRATLFLETKRRMSLLQLLFATIRKPFFRNALETCGYRTVEARASRWL